MIQAQLYSSWNGVVVYPGWLGSTDHCISLFSSLESILKSAPKAFAILSCQRLELQDMDKLEVANVAVMVVDYEESFTGQEIADSLWFMKTT